MGIKDCKMKKHKYTLSITNGRVKVYIDGLVMVTFNQLDFKAYYSFKDDTDIYGIEIYLVNGVNIETYYKKKETWIEVLKLLDKNL